MVGGALVLRRSPATGALLAATGFAWFLGGLLSWLVFLHRGPLVHLLLSFPRGRLESRFERAVVAGAYAEALVYPLGRSSLATLVLLAALLVASLVRHARAGGAERRARAAALLATSGVVAVLGAAAVARLSGTGADATWLWAYEIVLALAGAGLSADLLWGRWTQAAVTGVVVELGDLDREGTLRAPARPFGGRSIARALLLGRGARRAMSTRPVSRSRFRASRPIEPCCSSATTRVSRRPRSSTTRPCSTSRCWPRR